MGSVTKSIGKIVGSVTGSTQADAAKSAAQTQANAANQASAQQLEMFNKVQQMLSPYTSLGTGSQNALLQAMGYNPTFQEGKLTGLTANPNATLQQKFSFNPNDLANTPGYQFALQQGQRAVQNSAAARGLGLSGAQIKGAADYAIGLANQTYNDQYNNALNTYNTNFQAANNNVNNLLQLLQTGQNSAAQTGTAGLNATNNAANYLTSGANALAAGKIGQANAYGNALQSGLGTGLGFYALSNRGAKTDDSAKTDNNPLLSTLGTGLGIYALMSDRRTKTDIKRVGQTDGGLSVYTYRYKGSPIVHMGVMADEAEKQNPASVIEHEGIKFVNYAEVR